MASPQGAVCWWGKTPLVRIGSGVKITKEVYIDILEEGIVPEVKELCGDNSWTFVHDGAPAHRAKKTKQWLEEQKVSSLNWPENSPDLNTKQSGELLSKRFSAVNPNLLTKSGR